MPRLIDQPELVDFRLKVCSLLLQRAAGARAPGRWQARAVTGLSANDVGILNYVLGAREPPGRRSTPKPSQAAPHCKNSAGGNGGPARLSAPTSKAFPQLLQA